MPRRHRCARSKVDGRTLSAVTPVPVTGVHASPSPPALRRRPIRHPPAHHKCRGMDPRVCAAAPRLLRPRMTKGRRAAPTGKVCAPTTSSSSGLTRGSMPRRHRLRLVKSRWLHPLRRHPCARHRGPCRAITAGTPRRPIRHPPAHHKRRGMDPRVCAAAPRLLRPRMTKGRRAAANRQSLRALHLVILGLDPRIHASPFLLAFVKSRWSPLLAVAPCASDWGPVDLRVKNHEPPLTTPD